MLDTKTNSSTDWPAPPVADAYYGLSGELVRQVEPETEADSVAILVQFLVAFGNIVGRSPHFVVGATRHSLKLFIAMVGETSNGRKGTAWDVVEYLFSKIQPDWVKHQVQPGGLSSGEGLIHAVRDPTTIKEPIRSSNKKIDGYQNLITDHGVTDKRLLIVESEFASTLRVMKRDGSTLSALIRNAWDKGDLATLTRTNPLRASGTHISIVGHITKDELLDNLTGTDAANGFGNRFIWLCVQRSKLLPEGGALDQVDLNTLSSKLKAAIEFAQTVGEMKRDFKVSSLWAREYQRLSKGRKGLWGAMTARATPQVMRMACIYALLDMSYVVRQEHLLAALALWEYSDSSCRYIFGGTTGDRLADKILSALRASPAGLTKTEINHSICKRNYSEQQLDKALGLLSSSKLARCEIEIVGTSKVERWLPVSH